MGRKRSALTITVTHKSVADPRSVEEGLDLWARFLARHAAAVLAAREEERAARERRAAPASADEPVSLTAAGPG